MRWIAKALHNIADTFRRQHLPDLPYGLVYIVVKDQRYSQCHQLIPAQNPWMRRTASSSSALLAA